MIEKEIIKKLAEKYIEIWEKYEKTSGYDENDKKLDAKLDLLDDIFEEFFYIEDVYIDNGWLKSKGEKIG